MERGIRERGEVQLSVDGKRGLFFFKGILKRRNLGEGQAVKNLF